MQLKELSLELTNECRLACLHCSSGSTPRKLTGELTISKHLELIEDARKLGATVLSLSGGEPLLYVGHDDGLQHRILTLIHNAVELGYEEVLLYTTGHGRDGNHIKDYKHIDELLEYGDKLTFIFSLHAVSDIVNDYIMNVSGTTANVKSSIRWLVERGANVNVHMVPMNPNFRHMRDVACYCVEVGVKKLNLLRFVPQTRGKQNIDELGMNMAEFAEMQFLMNSLLQLTPIDLEIRLGCPIDFRHAVGLSPRKAKPCHAGDDLMLVRPTGDVHPCAAWKSLPCDTNVKVHPLKWIWENSEVFNRIRNFKHLLRTGKRLLNMDVTCRYCDMLSSCLTGCPAQRIHAMPQSGMDALTDSIYSDPLCPRGNGEQLYEAVNGGAYVSTEHVCRCGDGCEGDCEVNLVMEIM